MLLRWSIVTAMLWIVLYFLNKLNFFLPEPIPTSIKNYFNFEQFLAIVDPPTTKASIPRRIEYDTTMLAVEALGV